MTNIAASINDTRFFGIEKVDLRARYGAPLDGSLHPLSTMGLASAQALYPNAGLTTSTNLNTFAQDLAAALQAECDLRTGSGGIIGVADKSTAMFTGQFALQDAARVWLHGGRETVINTSGCGTTPAIRVSNGNTGKLIRPLHGLNLIAATSLPSGSTSGGGAAYTGYVTGAVAFAIDNTIGADFTNMTWSGYDRPLSWGNNVYGIAFRNWAAGLCNVGFNWDQTVSLNSMERLRLEGGNAANNNIGIDIQAYFGANSQGGSIFINDNGMDYNTKLALQFNGLPSGNYNSNNGLHVSNNHIETTGACSGTTPRCHVEGTAFFTNNEFYENDAGHPTGFVNVEAFSAVSGICNRTQVDRLPLFISNTAALYVQCEGHGNVSQNPNQPFYLFKGTDGIYVQPSKHNGQSIQIRADPNPLAIEQIHTYFLLNYTAAGNFTIPAFGTGFIPVNTVLRFRNIGSSTVTLAAASGVTLYAPVGGPNIAPGGLVEMHQYDVDKWLIVGTGLS